MFMKSKGFLALAVAAAGLVTAASLAGCGGADATRDAPSEESEVPAVGGDAVVGSVWPGGTTPPIAYEAAPRYRAVGFYGAAGEDVVATIRSDDGVAVAHLVDDTFAPLAVEREVHDPARGARVASRLPRTGVFYVVFRERDLRAATFTVSLWKSSLSGDAVVGGAYTIEDAGLWSDEPSPPDEA